MYKLYFNFNLPYLNINLYLFKFLYNTMNICMPNSRNLCNSNSKERVAEQKMNLNQIYEETRKYFESKKLPKDVSPKGVFANSNLDLKKIDIYGFDYDYTIACYKESLKKLLYTEAVKILTGKLNYPNGISELPYHQNYHIRGLHYDIETGLFLKVDSHLQIQMGTVYRGRTPLTDDEVESIYKNRILPKYYVEGNLYTRSKPKMVQFCDLFSIAELALLGNVTEYFEKKNINYHPEILYNDVHACIGQSHPIMHQRVIKEPPLYISKDPLIRAMLFRYVDGNKKLFLVTNSPYQFVNAGMTYLVGEDWRTIFDVIVVSANKPKFFFRKRPMRYFDDKYNKNLWDQVSKLQKGKIYCDGSIFELLHLTRWKGNRILYYGDHPYSDLADVTLRHGWKTGAIIKELNHEISIINSEKFKTLVNWYQMLTQLMEDYQDDGTSEGKVALAKWSEERSEMRQEIKHFFNDQFGSVFRTYNNPTYFSRRLFRFADIYTSNLGNMLNYGLEHVFYPRRGIMPHEYSASFM